MTILDNLSVLKSLGGCLSYQIHCFKFFYQGCQKQPKENFPYSFGRSWWSLLGELAAIERATITDSLSTFLRPCWELKSISHQRDFLAAGHQPDLPRLSSRFTSFPCSFQWVTSQLPSLPPALSSAVNPQWVFFSFADKATFKHLGLKPLTQVNSPIWFTSTGIGPQETVWLGSFAFKPGAIWRRPG